MDAVCPPYVLENPEDVTEAAGAMYYVPKCSRSTIPKQVRNDTTAVVVDIGNTKVTHIPRRAPMNANVRVVIMNGSILTKFPKSVLFMKNLVVLDIRYVTPTVQNPTPLEVPEWVSQINMLEDLRLPCVTPNSPRNLITTSHPDQSHWSLRPCKDSLALKLPGTSVQPPRLHHLMFSTRDRYGGYRATVYSTQSEILIGIASESYKLDNY